jgi:sugar-specific transcriptional regulator TrmB
MNQKELNENLYTALRELGLTDLEINLYTVSLRLGPSPISTIAESMGISRPNVYKVIQGLERHGLARFSERGKYARNFIVESPTEVVAKLRNKKEKIAVLDNDLVSELPNLLALYHQGEGDTKIKVFKGREQYVKLVNQILDESGEVMEYFGSATDYINFLSWETERVWINKRIKKNIFIKVLLLPGETAENFELSDREQLRETRILKDSAPFITSFQLFANKVAIWQPKAPLAILIEDEFIVAMLRSVFYKLWNGGPNNHQ